MLSRILHTSVAASRRLSTRAAVAAAPAKETPYRDRINAGGDRLTKSSAAGDKLTKSSAAEDRFTKSNGGGDTLGRRLFALVYAKRSAVVTIRKWKEEGHLVRKYELNRIVRELRKLKRYKHALEICEWMRTQDDMKLLPGDYAVHLDLIAKIRGLKSAEKFFEDLPEETRDSATCTALLHTYVQHKQFDSAEALMKKMSECNFLKSPLPYNHMMSLYLSTGQLEKIPETMKELKKITSPDVVTYNLLLAACGSQNLTETAEKVFLELTKAKIEPDWVTYSTLASIYIKSSNPEKAEFALKDMERKVSRKFRAGYSSLISLHTNLENKNGVRRIWKKIKSTYRKPNDSEYTCVISSLVKLNEFEEAEKLYEEWESISPTKDSRVPNLLLAVYINNNDKMEKAEAFYDRMVKKDIVPGYTTYELLTWGYSKQKEMDKVLDCFKKMVKSVRKWDPDEELVREVFGIVEEFGNVDAAEKLVVTLRRAGYVNGEVYKCLLRTYVKAGKMALIVEERMKKDKVEMDEEIQGLVQLTSKMCVSEIPGEL
ncbi:pentatricopeptide repeat-containing protein at4g02820 mitochondrial [Phtheirospermum japonicum]|uniref:Pentatricopeptide repeat-containing protein at4g02820 mitochondrial n=1 Tax=Phtheirospermum japonicum TaxID=374723 RepID=A0A830BXU5_9LAMI|nr:pentatricopeptide repeat-containing protein at4g02820 mitochondrial [Phtheirospermum japonicum]